MANEAVLVLKQEEPIDFIVADGAGIEKGTLLTLTDPRTAVASSASGAMCAGIAHREKIADDGRTRLAVIRKGIFRMTASGVIAIGAPVMSGINNNEIVVATGVNGAAVIGTALEAAAADGEEIEVAVNIGTGGELA